MNRDLLDRLEGLVERDLATRRELLERGALYGRYDEQMQAVHRDNAQALAAIVAEHGWPGADLVGPQGARAAWPIAQHAICTPALQRGFLEALREAARAGRAPARQVALLTDRIRFNEGAAQVYGTVYDWDEDGRLGCAVENPGAVDERRAAVGLPPFEESLEAHRREVASEGGRPPDDLRAYRREQSEWGRRVGWRQPP